VRDVAGYVSERGVLRVEFLIHIGLAVRLQRSLAYGRGFFRRWTVDPRIHPRIDPRAAAMRKFLSLF
jgi:hypothetical protein